MFKSQFLHFHRDIFSVSQFPIGKADYNSRSCALTRVGFAAHKLWEEREQHVRRLRVELWLRGGAASGS